MSVNRWLVVCALLGACSASRADAVSFNVDSNVDAPDATPGDGVCADSSGGCTLRAAVEETNALAGADSIDVPGGTITLAPVTGYAALVISDDLELRGAGRDVTVVDGNRNGPPPQHYSGVLRVAPDVTVVVRDLTLQHGLAYGGGFDNGGTATLISVAVRGCFSPNVGGGVQNQVGASLVLLDTVISGNGSVNVGGGLYNEGTLMVVGSTFANNAAGNSGGGIHSDRGATIVSTTFTGNYSGNVGGGMALHGSASLVNSTLSGNSAGNTGGGAHVDGYLGVNNATITGNSAGNVGGGISVGEGSAASIRNSILYANTSRMPDCEGNVSSGGHNVIGSLTGCDLSPSTGDQIGVDPLLGPLQDNGGATETHAIDAASPALDAGGSDCEWSDQRNIPRPQGAGCDVGAYEVLPCNNDATVDPGEDCDDGNAESGDGCTSLCQIEMLAGASLRLSLDGTGARLKTRARDSLIRLGWGNVSADDPVLHGATLRVRGAAGEAFDQVYDLPAENWSYIGRIGRNRGYRYKDDAGPIEKILVRPGKTIQIQGAGAGLQVTMDVNPAPVDVILTLGERTYVTSFGGDTAFRPGVDYRARKAPRRESPL